MFETGVKEDILPELKKWVVREPETLGKSETEVKEYVRAIVLNPSGQVLLLRRKEESSFEGGKWELPGGKLEAGEHSDEALLRELYEETGLNGELIEQVPVLDERIMTPAKNSHGGKIAKTQTKFVMVDDSTIDQIKLLTESMDAKWCSKRDIEELYEKEVLSKTTLDLVAKVLMQ